MTKFKLGAFFLSVLSYFFLGLSEEFVLAAATLLFLVFFLDRIKSTVAGALTNKMLELEEFYSLIFLYRKSYLYKFYSVLVLKKESWYFLVRSKLYFSELSGMVFEEALEREVRVVPYLDA